MTVSNGIQKLNLIAGGQSPLDYRLFETRKPKTDYHVLELHWNVGEHLAFLFRTKQWCFGEHIVELAELEDLEVDSVEKKHSIIPTPEFFSTHHVSD